MPWLGRRDYHAYTGGSVMKVTQQKAMDAVVGFLEQEMSKMTNPVTRAVSMFSVGVMASNTDNLAQKASMLGIMDADGMVDTDLVRSGFSMMFRNGNTVDLLGLKFSQADGDTSSVCSRCNGRIGEGSVRKGGAFLLLFDI